MDEVLGGDREQVEKLAQFGLADGGFQVFYNVELDVAVAQDFQRTSRFPSVGVVVDGDFFHGGLLF